MFIRVAVQLLKVLPCYTRTWLSRHRLGIQTANQLFLSNISLVAVDKILLTLNAEASSPVKLRSSYLSKALGLTRNSSPTDSMISFTNY